MKLPTITEAADMLTMLRADPVGRAISSLEVDGPEISRPAVVTVSPNCKALAVLAWIKPGSEAGLLLDTAYTADISADAATWAGLPVRYGPHCSMWVLPEHPKAPTRAGGWEDDGEV